MIFQPPVGPLFNLPRLFRLLQLGTTILELEEQKQFGEAAKRAPRDEEYGIAVTKVVERMVDPSHFVPETTQ